MPTLRGTINAGSVNRDLSLENRSSTPFVVLALASLTRRRAVANHQLHLTAAELREIRVRCLTSRRSR